MLIAAIILAVIVLWLICGLITFCLFETKAYREISVGRKSKESWEREARNVFRSCLAQGIYGLIAYLIFDSKEGRGMAA